MSAASGLEHGLMGLPLCVLCVLCVFGCPASASAEPPEAPEQPASDRAAGAAAPRAVADDAKLSRAKALYRKGLDAYAEGRYRDAVDYMLEADRSVPSAALCYNIALAYEAMRDGPSALEWLRSYLRRDPDAPDREAVRQRIEAHQLSLQQRGVQQATILSTPEGATVVVDGRRVGVTPFTLELVPGRHRLELELDGHATFETVFELAPDRAIDVMGTLEPRPEPERPVVRIPAPAPAPAAVKPAELDASGATITPWAWVALGAGAASLGASVVFEVRRANAASAAERAAQVDYQREYDRMKSQQTLSRVFLGAGSALVIVGSAKLVVDLSSGSESATMAGVLACGETGLCATARGKF